MTDSLGAVDELREIATAFGYGGHTLISSPFVVIFHFEKQTKTSHCREKSNAKKGNL